MIHPTNLLRTDSNGQHFAAPLGNYFNDIDCGIMAIPCFAKRLKLEKFAKFGIFVCVLSVVGFTHGVVLSYFRGTSQLWIVHYNLSTFSVGWIIYGNEIFAGIFALCVAYWGNRIHRATWMGALTIFLSISSLTLAIPEIYNPFTAVEINSAITGPSLCNSNLSNVSMSEQIKREFDEVSLSIFIFFQAMVAFAKISFTTHGMSYIDDHISPKHSPAFIGLALAASEIGKQFGLYCSWAPYIFGIDRIFVSPVWIVIIIVTFIMGSLMALFPRVLPSIVMMKSVNSLVSLASGLQPDEEDEIVDGFFTTLWRLLKNKILLLNIFSFVLIDSALINFSLLKRYFNQSKYHVSIEKDTSGYSDPEFIQFTTNLLVQPLVSISIVTAGMVISKIRPKAKYLIAWNIMTFVLIAMFFGSTVFWNCTKGIQNEHKHAITIPFCSSDCACPQGEPFQPVCVDGKTYFSPCLAGCEDFSEATNVYHNCSCGETVTEGSCDVDNCRIALAIGQTNSIITNGLLATTWVTNIVINIRSVLERDKAMALGLALTFSQITPYIPMRLVYLNIVDIFCEIETNQGCQYFSELFPLFLSIITIVMMILAAVVALILLFFINDMQLYTGKHFASSSDLQIIRSPEDDVQAAPSSTNGPNFNFSKDEESPFIRQLSRSIRGPSKNRGERLVDGGDLVPPLRSTSRMSNRANSSGKSDNASIGESLEAMANELGDPIFDSVSLKSSKSNQRLATPQDVRLQENMAKSSVEDIPLEEAVEYLEDLAPYIELCTAGTHSGDIDGDLTQEEELVGSDNIPKPAVFETEL